MPVTVQCFHCNAILDLDDGFRGGICRCSNCGSLLQVPRGEESSTARKVRPATPPSPVAPAAPVSNATSSKLDVGMSRGQFDMPSSSQMRRGDLDISSGLAAGRIVPTTPLAAPRKIRRPPPPAISEPGPIPPQAPEAVTVPARKRGRAIFWLTVVLILVTLMAIASLVIYCLFFYEH